MINISKEEDSPTKKEVEGNTKINKASSSSSSSPWLRLKDPRIVRVSRAFGGIDRHSKVCTVRGLRDRRVRLSVPTAIQLYDLQDRLGLNQPSKVVDWLLDAAQHEIDELPPLPNFNLNHHEFGVTTSQINNQDGLLSRSQDFWSNNDTTLRARSKQVHVNDQKENWIKRTENCDQRDSSESLLVHSSSPSGLMNNTYGSFFQLDHPNYLAGFGSQTTDHDLHNLNAIPLHHPSALSLSFVPQPYNFHGPDTDPRQINQFQMLSSSTQNLFPSTFTHHQNPYSMNQQSSGSARGFNFNIAPRLFNSNSQGNGQAAGDNKDQDFSL